MAKAPAKKSTGPIEVIDQHPIKCDINIALGDKTNMVYENHRLIEAKDHTVETEDAAGRKHYFYGTFVVKVVS